MSLGLEQDNALKGVVEIPSKPIPQVAPVPVGNETNQTLKHESVLEPRNKYSKGAQEGVLSIQTETTHLSSENSKHSLMTRKSDDSLSQKQGQISNTKDLSVSHDKTNEQLLYETSPLPSQDTGQSIESERTTELGNLVQLEPSNLENLSDEDTETEDLVSESTSSVKRDTADISAKLSPSLESLENSSQSIKQPNVKVTKATVITTPITTVSTQEYQPRTPSIEYPIDAGVIRCVCGFDDDDGFTIQCERCNAWQHAQCVNIEDEEHVPEIYLCDQCGDMKVDVQRAKDLQSRRLQQIAMKKKTKSRSRTTDSKHNSPTQKVGTSNNNTTNTNNVNNNNTSFSGSPSDPSSKKTTGSSVSTPSKKQHQHQQSHSRHYSSSQKNQELDNSQSENNSVSSREPGKSGGSTIKKRKRRMTVNDGVPPSSTSNSKHIGAIDATDSDVDGEDRLPLIQEYQTYFIKVDHSRVASPAVDSYLQTIKDLDMSPEVCSVLSQSEVDHIKPCKLSVRPTADPTKQQKFVGFTKFGLFADTASPKDRFIIEHLGEIMFQSEYKRNTINQYRHFGCPKQGVLFIPDLDIAVDGRRWGSEAAFIRRSCKPTVKISTIIVKDRPDIHFAVFAVKPIKAGNEITIGWDWDLNHPVQKLLAGEQAENLSKEERQFLVKCADMIQQRGMECACNAPDCIINQMKEADGILRNTRGGASRKARETHTTITNNNNNNNKTDSSPSVTTTINGGKSTNFYSAREERKLQDAMLLINKIEKEEEKKRMKSSSIDSASTEDGHGRYDSINTEESGTMVSKSIQTEPVVKRLRKTVDDHYSNSVTHKSSSASPRSPGEVVIPPNKRRLMEFFSKRQAYLRTPTPAKQLSPPPSANQSPTLGYTSIKASPDSPSSPKFIFKVPSSSGGLNIDFPGVSSSSGSTTPLISPNIYSPMVETPRPITSSERPLILPTTVHTVGGGISTPSPMGSRPPVKKKLSFADYKKKQNTQTPSTID